MNKRTRIRYKKLNDGILKSDTFISRDLSIVSIQINPETSEINLVDEFGDTIFGLVDTTKDMTSLKKLAKDILKENGVSFHDDVRKNK